MSFYKQAYVYLVPPINLSLLGDSTQRSQSRSNYPQPKANGINIEDIWNGKKSKRNDEELKEKLESESNKRSTILDAISKRKRKEPTTEYETSAAYAKPTNKFKSEFSKKVASWFGANNAEKQRVDMRDVYMAGERAKNMGFNEMYETATGRPVHGIMQYLMNPKLLSVLSTLGPFLSAVHPYAPMAAKIPEMLANLYMQGAGGGRLRENAMKKVLFQQTGHKPAHETLGTDVQTGSVIDHLLRGIGLDVHPVKETPTAPTYKMNPITDASTRKLRRW